MIGIAITAILSTIFGYGVCAMMVVGKQADEQISSCPFVNCKSDCIGWPQCERYCSHDN